MAIRKPIIVKKRFYLIEFSGYDDGNFIGRERIYRHLFCSIIQQAVF
ncbi:MAG: hypothetical protein ACI4J6_01715 [Oscillospiraceae bacterium]